MDNTNNNGASVPPKNSGNSFAISKINASLKNHTVTAQDLENWLIYSDSNGQLVGWITKTIMGDYTSVRLSDSSNNFEFYFKLKSYQKAINFIIGSAK